MFDFDALMKKRIENPKYTVNVRGEDFLVQRFSGKDYTDYLIEIRRSGLTSSALLRILSENVFYGPAEAAFPLKEMKAGKLIDCQPELAMALADKIFLDSHEFFTEGKQAVEEQVKN